VTGPHTDPDPAATRDHGEPPARSRTMSLSRKLGVLLVGVPLVALGIALLPLPGPGSLVILAGLAVLAVEFAWAERWSRRIRDGFVAVWERLTSRR
jgi:uncharacterized protein (TIGR02611 family)